MSATVFQKLRPDLIQNVTGQDFSGFEHDTGFLIKKRHEINFFFG
jgi:hypothetical protein